MEMDKSGKENLEKENGQDLEMNWNGTWNNVEMVKK